MAALFSSIVYADDITLPLDDGSIAIHAQFIRITPYGNFVPELALKIKNQTSSPWRILKLQFDIGGLCNGEPRVWNLSVNTSLGWLDSQQVVKDYVDTSIPLVGTIDECTTEVIKGRLILAESFKTRINGVTGEKVDLAAQLREIEDKRQADAAAKAEEERLAKEAQAREDEAEAKKTRR